MASLNELPQFEGLSKRAVEILHLLAEGMSDREIAERLVMTINTVKWYNRQIYSILGVGSRTQAIARARELQLLDGDNVTPPTFQTAQHRIRHNLPVETTHFIGRKHEIGVIKQLLNTAHLLTLVGPPGTGKTRLSLQIAREVADKFRDGVYFVSLASINDPSLVVDTIASVIGVNEVHGQPLIETAKNVLRQSHLLLILDNFEHLLPAAKQVSELLLVAPHMKVLATSREPLHLYGEQEYAVPPLELPEPEHLDLQALADCESTALFVQQAQTMRSGFTLTAENALDVAKICVRLEGLPLAIELAAARIKLLTPRTLLARLANRLDTLTGGAYDLPARQQTLYNTIEWSYNLLNEGEKMLFAWLAVFQGGCSLEAIEAVCSRDLPIHVFDALESLVNKSLIQQKELPGGEPRFTMLEMLHEYAWKQLTVSSLQAEIARRHSVYYLGLVAHYETAFYGVEPQTAVSVIRRDLDNIRQAWQWAFEHGVVEQRAIAPFRAAIDGLAAFYEVTNLFEEGQAVFAHAAEEIEREQQRVEAGKNSPLIIEYQAREVEEVICHLLARVAEFAGWRGEVEQAYTATTRVIELAERLNLPRYRADVLQTLGILERDGGATEQAIQHLKEAALIYRTLGAKRPLAATYDWLGLISSDLCKLEESMDYLSEAATLYAEAGNERGMVFNKGMTAVVLSVMGRLEESLIYQRNVLVRYQKLDYPLGEGRTANNLGLLLLDLGEFEEALTQLENATQIAQQIGNMAGFYNSLGNKGEIHLALDEYNEAQDCFQRAGRFYHDTGMHWLESENLWRMGWLLLNTGENDQARVVLEECLALAPKEKNPESFAMAHGLLAKLEWLSGHLEMALVHFEQASEAFQAVRRHLAVAYLLFIPQAALLLERGETVAAEATLAKIWSLLDGGGRHPIIFESYLLRAKIAAAHGNQAKAQEQIEHLLSSNLRPTEQATAHYQLWQLTGNEENGRFALALYQQLATHSPNLVYHRHLSILRAAALY